MIIYKPTHRTGAKPVAAWVGTAALTLGFLFGSPAAFAVAPLANTVIGNQASASYTDPNGITQLASSNLVQTTVQQVGSFNLDGQSAVTTTVVNTKTGAAGATVYAPHTLTNTGNGADKFIITVDSAAAGFSRVEVFADANGDGLPDNTTALCTATPAATCSVPAQTVAGNNGVFQFVVAYSIPNAATTPTTPFAVGTVKAVVDPTSPVIATYGANTQAADVDNVNLTIVAAFNATKAIGTPAVAWSLNGGVWPVATTTGPRSVASCAATTAGAISPAAGCVYTTYTLNLSNTGGAVGKIAISDTLPSGFTYVPGSAVWSSAPGAVLTDAALGDPAGIDFRATGNTVTAVVAALNPNVTQSVSFVVLVNDTASIGTSSTTNTATYNPSDAPAATSAAPGTLGSSTNPASYTVTASYSLAMGSVASTAVTAKDTVPGTPNGTAADLTVRPSVSPGGSVVFTQTVYNTGNATDTVNVTAQNVTFPTGTTFQFFNAGGVVALLDTTGDGVVDTGPIAVNSSVSIIVRANVPAGTTAAGPYTVNVRGVSAGDTSKIDATQDQVTALIASAALIDLTNTAVGTGIGNVGSGDLGAGPSPSATTTVSTPAGSSALFTLFLKNNDSIINSYNLSASQTAAFPGSLPAGWTVKYVAGGATCSAAAISQPVAVAVAAQVQVDACVTPPVSQTPVVAQPMYFRVTSTAVASTGAIVSDTKLDAVTVTIANTFGATLTPDNNGQVAAGGSVVYAHTLTSTGAQSCGSYTLAASPTATALGWTTVIYVDVNGDGQLDAGDTLYTTGSLSLGAYPATQKLLVKVFAPGGAAAGAADVATVTATFAANCGAPSATDTSTVITGQIRLVKTQGLNAACNTTVPALSAAPIGAAKPGDCIVYRVVATNEGAAPVSNLAINDAIPAYTSLSATQPAVRCESTGITTAFTTAANYASTAVAVSCGSAANSVIPGGSATMTFSVKINN
ncbi:MAG: conserved repeat domain protein [Polaromonas sp.]|nr:conserved repeat domain protein [Polaromonas sp.]